MSDFLERISKLSPQRLALLACELNERVQEEEERKKVPLAVVGIGCRFPGGVDNPDSFWKLLCENVDAIREVPSSRWDIEEFFDRNPDVPGKMVTRWGGFIDSPEQFDPKFFGIAPTEAVGVDPQQRLLLETAWEALEDAGIAPSSLAGTPTGVFVGICNADYSHIALNGPREKINPYLAPGLSHAVAAGRISYVLGLQGPSLSVDTSCSASLVAVHLACQSLRLGECNTAITGGVNLILNPDITIALSQSRMMAPDGRCKAFSGEANGFVRGEGSGMIVLKRLPDAVREGNRILAVIRGSACNQDGRSSGLTAPNGPSQEAVITAALTNGGLRANDVDYIETHGTGTSLGDPIEAEALNAVFAGRPTGTEPLRIGSVKTNIGHLESAAGIAGLIKLVLSIQHGKIPASLHFQTPNRRIEWDRLPLKVPTQLETWESRGAKRTGGVSSFGFSGTNAHVIVEEYVEKLAEGNSADGRPELFQFSAKTASALQATVARLRHHLEEHRLPLADVARTLSIGRSHFEYRAAVVADSHAALTEYLRTFANSQGAETFHTGRTVNHSARVAFVFGGENCFGWERGRAFYEAIPVFRKSLQRCEEILRNDKEFGVATLTSLMFPQTKNERNEGPAKFAQSVCFALQFAMSELWRSCGIEPSAVLGYGIGELVAAHVAGVLSLEDALRLSCALERGNANLAGCASRITFHAPQISFISNQTEDAAGSGRVRSAEYWSQCAESIGASPAALAKLAQEDCEANLYVGDCSDIPNFKRVSSKDLGGKWLSSLNQGGGDLLQTMNTAAALYVLGCKLDMSGLFGDTPAKVVALPTYPFERERYWLDVEAISTSSARGPVKQSQIQEEGRSPGSADASGWVYDLVWEPKPLRENSLSQRAQRFGVDLIEGITAPAASEALLRVSDLTAQLTPIYSTYIVQILQELGLNPFPAAWFTVQALCHDLGIIPSRRRVLERMLAILVEDGLALRAGDQFKFADVQRRPDADSELDKLETAYPECQTEINILRRCTRKLAAVLRGTYDPMQLVFADGSIDEAEQIYERSPVCRFFNDAARDVIAAAVSQISDRKVRILEIGAGTGATTASVLQALEDKDVEYTFTDVSPVFLARARDKFRDVRGMLYRLLDIEHDPLSQDFDHAGYDIILAANVLHATADLRRTLAHTRKLLAPNGLLLLIEGVRPDRWLDLTFGLTDGWWRFTDLDLRREHPLVSDETWTHLFRETHMNHTRTISYATGDGSRSQQVLMLAQAPGDEVIYTAPQEDVLRHWVVFADKSGVGAALHQLLTYSGQSSELIFRPDSDRKIDAEFRKLGIRAENTPVEVVYLWGLDVPDSFDSLEHFSAVSHLCTKSIVHLIQALAKSPDGVIRLWLATSAAQATTSFSPSAGGAVQSMIWGVGRVLGLESPELYGALIDLDPALLPEEAAASLFKELRANDIEDQVAHRGNQRLVARLRTSNIARLDADSASGPGLRGDGSYLVVGGLGGVGLRLAKWAAAQRPGHLVLLSRTGMGQGPFAKERAQAVQEIVKMGIPVTIVEADVASRTQMEPLFMRFGRDLPPLRGIFHTATALSGAEIVELSDTQIETMLQPKVLGVWVLHELTKNVNLDFFLAFSSTTSLLGAKGMAHYAAANQFLDSFAHYRRAQGLPMLTINWGAWDVMNAVSSQQQALLKNIGLLPMDSAKALQTTGDLTRSSRAQVMIANVDWNVLKPSLELRRVRPLLAELGHPQVVRSSEKAPATPLPQGLASLAGTTLNGGKKSVEAFVLAQTAQVLGMRGGELPPCDIPLTELGLDSLMAIDLKNRLQRGLGQELSPTIVFDYPTVSSMVELLETMLWAAHGNNQDDLSLLQKEEISL